MSLAASERSWEIGLDFVDHARSRAMFLFPVPLPCNLSPVILGTGVDITEVPRIRHALERYGERFLKRVFTAEEIRYCSGKLNAAERLAARFAAKEAGMKAIGTGLRGGVTWKDMEVVRRPGQRPQLQYSGRAAEIAAALGCKRVHLSLSHTAEQAIAHVILEGE